MSNIARFPRLKWLLWIVALFGYGGPWIAQPSAALAWNAYDMFDVLRLLPEIETGAISVNLQALRLPLVGLAVLPPLLCADLRWPWRVIAAVVGAGLALATLPPYPEIVTAWRAPGWRIPFWWGVGAMLAAGALVYLAPRLGTLRPWLALAWLALTGLPALPTFHRLLPALHTLHARPVGAGWGLWLWAGAALLLALSFWYEGANRYSERFGQQI